jgi:hypothetical protein
MFLGIVRFNRHGFCLSEPLGGTASGSSMSSAAPLGLARGPREIVGATMRSDNRFTAIEHALGARISFPFGRLLCGAQKLAAFFCANRI